MLNFQQRLRHLTEDRNSPNPGEIHLPLQFSGQMWPTEAEKTGGRESKRFFFFALIIRGRSDLKMRLSGWRRAKTDRAGHVVVINGSQSLVA